MRAEAARVIGQLRPRIEGARWVPPQNLHVTLAFLGRTSLVDAVAAAVRDAAGSCMPLSLRLEGAGAFPSERHARVVWLGLGGDTDALASLAATLWEHLAPLGFEPESRPFSAHLTLARLRMPEAVDLSEVRVEPLLLPVEAVTLFESRIQRPAPVYTPVLVAQLRP